MNPSSRFVQQSRNLAVCLSAVIQILQPVPNRLRDRANRNIPAAHYKMFRLNRRVAFNIKPDKVPLV